MATARSACKTTQVTDPRIEPQPDPVYTYVVGPTQNQFYTLNNSAMSDSYVAFNNLTTLGTDRAYLDTMELLITAEISFIDGRPANDDDNPFKMPPDSWTFDSFPFNKRCEQIRVNINGGSFFSEPLSYLKAKERYMDQRSLSRCYENICPIHRAYGQTESGKVYTGKTSAKDAQCLNTPFSYTVNGGNVVDISSGWGVPTRYGIGMFNAMQSDQGLDGAFNNAIVETDQVETGLKTNYEGDTQKYTVTWREPICCSPFSSRYDATYGRPLYNITSLDLSFNLISLENMIRAANYRTEGNAKGVLKEIKVHLKDVQLCYQVMTIPSTLNKPLTTLVPYRRFVPYVTAGPSDTDISNGLAVNDYEILSGTYTLNEIPTAIWVFCAPDKASYQTNVMDIGGADATNNVNYGGNFDSNKVFGFLKHISINMANTTQILDTAKVEDLYRIAKANGCEDSFLAWGRYKTVNPKGNGSSIGTYFHGPGSVLRLIPGVDLVVPDQALIPGANANNMVFQARAKFYIPPHSKQSQPKYSLWLLFEYVGVAAISPGQCEVTMNPLGSGEVMAVSPVISGTTDATDGTLGGAGIWDRIRKALGVANHIAKDTGIVSKILKAINNPTAQKMGEYLASKGYGAPAKKCKGGAVMGLGDWA